MSSLDLPTKEQCESWTFIQVANFLAQNGMHECAATVRRLKIDGLWLLNLSDSDLGKFSLLQLPQLQKMVEGIKKNDGSIMNRLKRFQSEQAALIRKTGKSTWNRIKKKPPPKLPTRDYTADDNEDGEEWSGSDFDSDTYEDPLEDEDNSYEPPPCEQAKRVFTPAPSASFPRGEYLDSLRSRPTQHPRHPAHSSRDHKPLPLPKQAKPRDDSEDYIDPEEGEDDNYIDPSESPTADPPVVNRGVKPAADHPPVSSANEESDCADLYEVPELEDKPPPERRTSAHLRPPKQCTPPRASPRLHIKKPLPLTEPVDYEDEDEYEVCDPDESDSAQSEESSSSSLAVPTPRPRGPNKPTIPTKPSALLPKREHEARPMALKHSIQSATPPPSDSIRERSSLPQRNSPPAQHSSPPAQRSLPPVQRSSPPVQRSSPPAQRSLPPIQRASPPAQHTSPAAQWTPVQQTSSLKTPVDKAATDGTKKALTSAEEEAGLYKKVWYTSTSDRRSAEAALTRCNKDGGYLVRKSSGQDPSQPYTLVVFYNSKVYNIPIRHIPATRQYALGREKTGEERFTSVSSMIEHHQRKALVLIDSQNNTKDSTRLLHAVTP
ncbi:hypothetical protein GJAV_G00239810 [Gymnothorax javanicus]|nr:hypothetical protein GJAV_G00239810 [Gymnothorax javanicus]